MIENEDNCWSINDSEYGESFDETIDCEMKENQVVAVKKRSNMNIQNKI